MPRSDFSRVSLSSAAGILLLLSIASSLLAAGPRVDIVIGEKAPALEKRAAEDVAADLKKLYDAEVKIATAAPEGADNLIFIGSLETDGEAKRLLTDGGLKLFTEDHVVRTIKVRGKPALLIGGGTSRSTYWAASEYAHELGIRSMLFGDLYPVSPPSFSLEGFELTLKLHRDRYGLIAEGFPSDEAAWGLADQKRLLRQLARLKYNRLVIPIQSWQPFVHFEQEGVKKQTGVLWYGWQFPVSGDTSGRAAFKGAKVFENPDFTGKATYEQRVETGQALLRGVIEEARALGMNVGLSIDVLSFPKEFSVALSDPRPVPEPVELAVRPGREQNPKDEKFLQLAKLQLRAYIDAYPQLDTIYLPITDLESPLTAPVAYEKPLVRKDGSSVEVIPGAVFFTGGAKSPHVLVEDSNQDAYLQSRVGFDRDNFAVRACRQMVTPICGEGVHLVVFKAQMQIEEANKLIQKNDHDFALPSPNMILKHYASSDPPPEWWSKVRDNYLGAMNDMYRANSRAREGGRSYTLYLARRCEFGYEYMNCVEATRLAGIARSKKDTVEQRAQLEKAIESMNSACSALAAVARDQSDRGMIAVCNEFGYKALQKELEKLDGE